MQTIPKAFPKPPLRSFRATPKKHSGRLELTKPRTSLPDAAGPPVNRPYPVRHHSSAQSPLEALGPAGPPPQSGRRPCDLDCLSHDASLRLATLPCMLHNAQSILTLPSRKKNLCQAPSSPIRHHSAAEIPHPVREGVPVMSSVSATMLCFASRLCPV